MCAERCQARCSPELFWGQEHSWRRVQGTQSTRRSNTLLRARGEIRHWDEVCGFSPFREFHQDRRTHNTYKGDTLNVISSLNCVCCQRNSNGGTSYYIGPKLCHCLPQTRLKLCCIFLPSLGSHKTSLCFILLDTDESKLAIFKGKECRHLLKEQVVRMQHWKNVSLRLERKIEVAFIWQLHMT
eukprot:XP_024305572.1 uncharacterized protein LOC112268136 [Homo sapiens]